MPIRQLFTPDECRKLGRCLYCGWHPKRQGHHNDCPKRPRPKASSRRATSPNI